MDSLALRSCLAIHPLSPAIFGPILAGIIVHEFRRRSSLEIELLVLIPSLWQVGWLRYFVCCQSFFGPALADIVVQESRRRSSLKIELLVLIPSLRQVNWLRYFAIYFGPALADIVVQESRRRSSLKIELLVLVPSLRQVDWLHYFARCRKFDRRRRAAVISHISRRTSAGIILLSLTYTAIPPIEKSLFQVPQSVVVRCRVMLVDLEKRGSGGALLANWKHGDGIKQIINTTWVFQISCT